MRILFITKHYLPRIGGVEKQVSKLSSKLTERGFRVDILTTKYDRNLKDQEKIDGVDVKRINLPGIKYFGLLYIWIWFTLNIKYFSQFDIIHTHGVFVWCWPLRFLLPRKPIFTTFHGWEGIYPIPLKNKIIRKVDAALAWGNITISDYVEKWYGIKADILSYTAVDIPKKKYIRKDKNRLLYVGRLDINTGLPKILKALDKLKIYKVDFCGDGELRNECQKYGTVHGFTDPKPFYEKAFICLSPGVTSILEAFTYKCLIVTTYDNPVKKDYLLMNPFSGWISVENTPANLAKRIEYFTLHSNKADEYIKKSYEWVKTQNWNNEVKRYLQLWKIER